MQSSIRDNYLETEVMTATPQKLQCMLIDAAIRNLNRAKQLRSENQHDEACEALIRVQEIVTQILCGLNREIDANLTGKVASVYMFVFRTLNAAQMTRDAAKLDECIRVLEVERETWRLLCEKLEQEQAGGSEPARSILPEPPPQNGLVTASSPGLPAPKMPALDRSCDMVAGEGTSTGFSIEA